MVQPLVSVIMPAYNAERFIGEALDSVLAQRYARIEVIVVDDGSDDATVEVVAKSLGAGIKLLRQRNAGPAAARNAGARAASGDYLAFLDADDVWLPGKLEAQVEHLRGHPEIQAVHTRFSRWYPGGDGRFVRPAVPLASASAPGLDAEGTGWVYPDLLLDSIVHLITALVRRALFERLGGFDEGLRTGEDYDFWLRASRHTALHRLAMHGALYRMHPSSTTSIPCADNYEYLVLRRALARFGEAGPDGRRVDRRALNRRLARLCFQHAHLHYWHGDPRVSARGFLEAFRHRPASLRTVAYLALSNLRCAGWSQRATRTGVAR